MAKVSDDQMKGITTLRLGWGEVWKADVDTQTAFDALLEAGFWKVIGGTGESVVVIEEGGVEHYYFLPPGLDRAKTEEALRYAGFSPLEDKRD